MDVRIPGVQIRACAYHSGLKRVARKVGLTNFGSVPSCNSAIPKTRLNPISSRIQTNSLPRLQRRHRCESSSRLTGGKANDS
jgi:hypothetical protein